MVDVVKNNLERIIDACKEMQLQSLFLFGSAAREIDFKNTSDLDFIFSFKKNQQGMPQSGYDYFDLLFKLQEITGKEIDLVAEERISNRYFLQKVNQEKLCIYES
jgi:predicted nucleotidyltransferase